MKNLSKALQGAERSKRIYQGIKRLLRSLKFILLSFILLLCLDVIFHLSPTQRINGLLIYIGSLSLYGLCMFYYSFITTQNIKKTAHEIEEGNTDLGSSLINSIELQEQINTDKISGMSRDLAKVAIVKYNEQWEPATLKETIKPRNLLKDFKAAFITLGIITLCLIPVRHILSLEINRFFDPHGDHPAFSLTTLKINIPSDDFHKVIYGDDIISMHKPMAINPKNFS